MFEIQSESVFIEQKQRYDRKSNLQVSIIDMASVIWRLAPLTQTVTIIRMMITICTSQVYSLGLPLKPTIYISPTLSFFNLLLIGQVLRHYVICNSRDSVLYYIGIRVNIRVNRYNNNNNNNQVLSLLQCGTGSYRYKYCRAIMIMNCK
jgi:hypothetical protein